MPRRLRQIRLDADQGAPADAVVQQEHTDEGVSDAPSAAAAGHPWRRRARCGRTGARHRAGASRAADADGCGLSGAPWRRRECWYRDHRS